jgi:hypothetical protein
LRDSKRKNIDMIKEFYLSIGDPKVFVWYILLFALYYYMVSPK